ncbi:serine/threonine-protein kinase [Streptomyces sp. NPDC048340]|uniref:serine/threonine-protein kinase n=1 Tax=Streptomyces sp. NPDC048340 TaxID=3365537 RepID=UPI00371BF420
MDGTTLAGRYRLGGRIGAGGMGEVWRARDLELAREVAIKVIAQPGDDKLAQRLRAEARAAAALSDPHVVSVHDVGETVIDSRTVVYLVMELVDGAPLGTARGPAAVEDVVRWAVQICEGLAAAHAAGVIHRDIKPGNVLLTRAGRIKICDFGIARQSGFQGLTTTGSVTGTPAYMSPEQARGETIDARSDLYGLGCLLYELLTGTPPFVGTGWEILAQHANKSPVPVRDRRPEVPVDLDSLVLQLLSKEAHRRPVGAAEVADRLRDIERVLEGPPSVRTGRPVQPVQPAGPVPATLTAPVPEPRPEPRPVPPRPEPVVQPPSDGRAPALIPARGAVWTGSVAVGGAFGGELAFFTVIAPGWAVVSGVVAALLFFAFEAAEAKSPPAANELSNFAGVFSIAAAVAMGTTLILYDALPWWGAVPIAVAAAPSLMFLAALAPEWITGGSGAHEAAFIAGNAALVGGVLTGWMLLATTRASIWMALGCGFLVWLLGGIGLGRLMPRRRPAAQDFGDMI